MYNLDNDLLTIITSLGHSDSLYTNINTRTVSKGQFMKHKTNKIKILVFKS